MTPNQTLVAYGNVIKKITLSLFLVVACNTFAQVGVGTQTPVTTLDVVGAAGTTPGALNTIDGIAVPVVTDDMTTTTTVGSRISQLVYSNNAASTGYYFWNGTAWAAMSGGDSGVSLGALTNVDISTNVTLPSTGSVFNLINGASFGGPTITLPPTTTAETGKIITILHTSSPTTTINLGNVVGGNTQLGGDKSGLFVSNGSAWVLVTED
jgi:hypothetical protein